jgi:UDP-N-acetylmuramoylalanine--D-glutamate ligase
MTAHSTFSVSGKRVVVVGAARSGVAAAKLLVRRGASVVLTDVKDRIDAEQELRASAVELQLGGHELDTLRNADLIVLSPGVPLTRPEIAAAKAAGVPVIGELELASRWLRGRLIAITGTKGKSTTTTLIGRMLDEARYEVLVGGNIGTALSAQVDQSTEHTIHVIEASSFQLQATETFHPWIAVLLNFSPDHLDHHADIAEYAAAKARIFANQTVNDWAVLNADDRPSHALAQDARAQLFEFTLRRELVNGVVAQDDAIVRRRGGEDDEVLVPLSAVKLLGDHLLSDVCAAAAVASLVGVGPEAMTRAVENFTGLEHAL